ncbi:MAG: hypothetical protein J7K40_08580 [candidate division Zixibacteria bacterium]|nr:hypothetical protein [candidate division Zixibacteria bacterium]
MTEHRENLIKTVESVSEQIQVLALNIAVAAAKMSFRKEIAPDVNNKLGQLVNQATLAVKNMGYILRAAKSERQKKDILTEEMDIKNDSETVSNIENSLNTILNDSQKILEMLKKVKQESLGDF